MRSFSIRQYLVLLVLVVMLPFAALHTYIVAHHVGQMTEEAHELVQRYATVATDDATHFLQDVEAGLSRLVRRPGVHRVASGGCRDIFPVLTDANPEFTSASLVRLHDGRVLCSSLQAEQDPSARIGARVWAAEAARKAGFMVSPAFIDPLTRHWTVALIYPVGRELAPAPEAVAVTIDLLGTDGLHYRTALSAERLPPGSTATVVDDQGKVLARWPEPEKWVGANAKGTPIVDYVLGRHEHGHVVATGLDGVEKDYGFGPVPGTSWRVYVGVPTRHGLWAQQFMWRDILLGLGVASIVTLLAAFFGQHIARPILALGRAAKSAKEGQMDIRVVPRGPSEIKRASDCFNDLLTARQLTEAALFEEKRRAEITLHSIGDAVVGVDTGLRITYLNPVAEQITGWTLAEAHGRALFDVANLILQSSREPIRKSLEQMLTDRALVALDGDTLLVTRDGRELDIADCAAPIVGPADNVLGAVLVFRDISKTRDLERRLAWQARHDHLTGLVNRAEFERRVVQALDEVKTAGRRHVLLYLDLDQFKVVNDACGHLAGDELLRRLTELLQSRIRAPHTLARVGGDEFGVLLKDCEINRASVIADGLRRTIEDFRFQWDGRSFAVGVSIGLVQMDRQTGGLDDVMNAADLACYAAKERGRNRVHVFMPEDETLRQRLGEPEWVRRISEAFELQRFRLCAQPIVPISGNPADPVWHEILLRMEDRHGNILPPGSFLPAAERYHMLTAVDRWVVATTFARLGAAHNPICCSINLTGPSISDDRFLDFVVDEFSRSGIAPERVCFEITETAAVVNFNRAVRFMNTLRGHGCYFALDDFGIGISSMAHLRALPFNFLKIDGRFVRDIERDDVDRAMVEAINRVGHVMHLKTVGEFVESAPTKLLLQALGVDYAQGFAITKPRPLEEFINGDAAVTTA